MSSIVGLIVDRLGELTRSEAEEMIALVLKQRREKEARDKFVRMHIEIMHTAYEWTKWSHENGAGLTYSTFCDDFGYEPDELIDRRTVFEAVGQLYALSEKYAHRQVGE